MRMGPVSEYPSAGNELTGPKHCRSLQESTFILRFIHSDIDRAWKRCHESDLKSQDCLLTHWLPMPSILAILGGNYANQLKCNYLINEKLFVNILMHF